MAAAVITATPAIASSWQYPNDTGSPLRVYYDGTERGAVAFAWRTGLNNAGAYSGLSAFRLDDRRTDGHMVYGRSITQSNAGICVSPEYTSCSQGWYNYSSANSQGWGSTTWSGWFYQSAPTDPGADYHRGRALACIQINYWPDHCDGSVYTRGVQVCRRRSKTEQFRRSKNEQVQS
ncbi:hypothetical protein, partial [Ornithinimicrobium tianjinense]